MLKIEQVTSEPESDKHGNLSYFVRIEGVDGGVLVRHKGDKPVLKAGDDATDHGFERVDDIPKKSGDGTYKKLMRPEANNSFGGGGGGGSRTDDPITRRSIQMQHAQKAAVDALRLTCEKGDYVPPTVADVAGHVKTIARALYDQIQEVAGEAA